MSSINTILNDYKKAKAKLSDAKLHPYFEPLFEKFPELESFSWTQYAPYFNDGDACTFSAHDIDRVNGHQEYEDDWDEQVCKGYGKTEKLGPLGAAYKAAVALKNSIPGKALETILGEGRVTVTKKKITVEDCDHD